MTIGVVDYRAGNLKSVETALRYLDFRFIISQEPEKILKTDRLIFPGVGEAGSAMNVLERTGLGEAIEDFARSGKLILGICLGCQIILDRSEESNTRCLGLIGGIAKMFPLDSGLKIPHMGWNRVFGRQEHFLFKDIPAGASFYFVHSYYPLPNLKETEIAYTEYGLRFSSALAHENITAVQFHPEKSGQYGLLLLKNFLNRKE